MANLQVEKCETDYIKECHIDYEIRAKTVKMEICKEAWARDCEAEGEVVCTMEEDAGKINQYLINQYIKV